MKKTINKSKICKKHKKGGCAVCAAAILLGGKSKRKSISKTRRKTRKSRKTRRKTNNKK